MPADVAMFESRFPAPFPGGLPQAVIFDMDGLMLDSERIDRLAWKAVASRHGQSVSDELYAKTIGRRQVDIEVLVNADFGAVIEFSTFIAEVRRWKLEYLAGGAVPVKPGVRELLEQLELAGIPRAVATSTVRSEALHSLGDLFNRLNAAAFGDEVSSGKPSPDIYLLAARRLSVEPDQCLALEDSYPGVVAAERAGMTAIMVPDLVAPDARVRFLCHSLSDVHNWLLRSHGCSQCESALST